MSIRGRIDGVVKGVLRAWAWDPADPQKRQITHLNVDGKVFGSRIAERLRKDLESAGIGDGHHSVNYELPESILDGNVHSFKIYVDVNGALQELDSRSVAVESGKPRFDRRIEGFDHSDCLGWVHDTFKPQHRVRVEALWDDQIVGETVANRFRKDLFTAGIGDGAYGFRLPLPLKVFSQASRCPNLTLRVISSDLEVPLTIGEIAIPSPDLAKEYGLHARELEKNGDIDSAVKAFDEALKIAPTSVDLLWRRARIAHHLGDVETAKVLAERGIKLNKTHVGLSIILARLAFDEGRHDDSLKLWPDLPASDSKYREKIVKTCRSLFRLGRHIELIKPAQIALRLRADDHEIRRLLAESFMTLGADTLSLHHWKIISEALPGDRRSLRNVSLLSELGTSARPGDPYLGMGILINPDLTRWEGPATGLINQETQIAPGVIVRPYRSSGTLSFSLAAPEEFLPGSFPHYGLRVQTAKGGIEILHKLDPAAASTLRDGIIALFDIGCGRHEADVISARVGILSYGDDKAKSWTKLWDGPLASFPTMVSVPLRLNARDLERLNTGQVFICVRTSAAPTALIWYPVRPSRRMPAKRKAVSKFEGPNIQKLLSISRP